MSVEGHGGRFPHETEGAPMSELRTAQDGRRHDLEVGLCNISIPEHMHEGLTEYVVNRRETGHFLTAVLENDLYSAVQTADLDNREALPRYVELLTEYCPAECWGSVGRVAAWRADHD